MTARAASARRGDATARSSADRTGAAVRRDCCGAGSARNGRDLPWRQTRDPYRILVSELMLQQTQVSRVVPCYDEFLDDVPDAARRRARAAERA